MSRAFLRASCAGFLLCFVGCQELVGIEPWPNGAGGGASTGALSTTTSGVTSSSSGASTVSSSSGTGCLEDCLGGACVQGKCEPVVVPIGDIGAGHLAGTSSALILATQMIGDPGAKWKIARVDKSGAPTLVEMAESAAVTAIAGLDPDSVYWISANQVFERKFTGIDNTVRASSTSSSFLGVSLRALEFGGDTRLCWVDAEASTVVGGIYCQPLPSISNPTQIAAFSFGGPLTGDGAFAYSIKSSGTSGAFVMKASPMSSAQPMVGITNAFDLAVDAERIYWVTNTAPFELGSLVKLEPSGGLTTVQLPSLPKRIVKQGKWVYVLSNTGILRYDEKSLAADPAFQVGIGGVPLDLVVDSDGVYWLTSGAGTSGVGFLAISSD
ncbi:MAG: hypothetical protein U0414_18110 [Polyangiaceae bacterium]